MKYVHQNIAVAQQLFMMCWKDADVGYGGKRLMKKEIEMDILTEMLFGKSKQLYNSLYSQGLINSSFSVEYNPQIAYAFTAIEGESPDPKKVYDTILDSIDNTTLKREDFDRVKKVVWGDYIRSFNDIESYAHAFLTTLFTDGDYFSYEEVYNIVTFEDVEKRFYEHFVRDRAAISVINPIEK